ALHRKPLVGNGDVHRLEQLGRTYSLVDAEPTADAICEAIAVGRVSVVAEPLSWATATRLMTTLVFDQVHFPWESGSRVPRAKQHQVRHDTDGIVNQSRPRTTHTTTL